MKQNLTNVSNPNPNDVERQITVVLTFFIWMLADTVASQCKAVLKYM